MRVRLRAKGPSAMTVVLEPSGAEYLLQPGDYIDYEWEDVPGPLCAVIDHRPDSITIGEANGRSRMWNSRGVEMSIIG